MRTIPIPAGAMTGLLTINILDGSIVECSESFNVRIVSVVGSGVIVGNVNNAEVIIMDNDGKLQPCGHSSKL